MENKVKTFLVIGLVFLANAIVFLCLDIGLSNTHFQGLWSSLFAIGFSLVVISLVLKKSFSNT
ncbi:hypothetical protein NBRC116493_30290 [Aurantivibrio infirmus]